MIDGKEVPLTRGKIQFQSEGAEVFTARSRSSCFKPATGGEMQTLAKLFGGQSTINNHARKRSSRSIRRTTS